MKKKWNWIDTTILIIIILAIIVFLNRDKISKSKKESSEANEKKIVFFVEGNSITEDMLTNLEIGDQIFSQNNLQDATVKAVEIEPLDKPSRRKFNKYEDADEIKAIVEIEGKVSFNGPYMSLGGQEIKVGLPFIMRTTKVEFPSKIKYIEVK